jgi:photosystem II stability/assembly factor-like uncharacterized protein
VSEVVLMSLHARQARLLPAIALAVSGVLLVGTGSATGQAAAPDPLRGIAKRQAAAHAQAAQHASAATKERAEGEGGEEEGGPLEVAERAEQYAEERSAPADSVSAGALLAARSQAQSLPHSSATLREITDRPYDAEPAGYTDPVESNAGAGFGLVSGRDTALAVDGRTYYAGAADGGVWRSRDAGRTWKPMSDQQKTLSIGALLTVHHDLWVGTGEANTSTDSYRGIGVLRSTDGGRTYHRVGGQELLSHLVFRLVDDHEGHVYAATSQGLYRHSSRTARGHWRLVLKPDPNPDGTPYNTSFISDVAVRPGTHGRSVLAVLGWRNGSSYNGFYLSTTGGGAGSFSKITPGGDVDATDIGRTTLAYSADGSRLYAIIQSPRRLATDPNTNLQGVYVSRSGDPAGPYSLIADSVKLGNSGSALKDQPGYQVGVQAWYNQALAVDPRDPDHVYVSLEEVFETRDGGSTFTTASPYWNFGLACGDTCPQTTHPDQHALALTSSRVVIGNDGGVFSRPLSATGYGHWRNLNRTLRTLQYYDAAAGRAPGGLTYWGGLQDNGTSKLTPHARRMIEPAGGDGGMVLVDPRNAQRAVGEYVYLTLYSTTDGGHTFRTISPECGYYTDETQCDPSARFISPIQADVRDTDHWVAAGNKVWDTKRGFDTVCDTACDWVPVHSFGLDDAGGYNVGTAVAVNGSTTYAAWVDSGGNPSPTFRSGIDTNYGGTWHRISSPVLPNRFVAGLTVDPTDPAHVYAVYNGYSRRWIPGGGLGTVFESRDGGATWSNISGNLPDAPGDGLALVRGHLVLGTDVGAFVASAHSPTSWRRVVGLPHAVVDNVRPLPGGHAVVAATHGRGMWRITLD